MILLALACASDTALDKVRDDVPVPPPAYDGGWTLAEDCPDRLADVDETGNDVGDTPPDFALLDQYGESVHLYAFCDRVVLLVWAGFG